ncbi:uncharacterized protein K452DRAFT_298063 [Aplosporella prunicola CBS 121167]|uniref:Enoyl reductase (ER) domain-containing protein n=1 Tax=Aplosporella prunicola CBS 121167 TaxID=1176127 RepID=A0A6A6BDD0_9PEZI|nr:uncharacterized protein K452DRAFT_298063 [Aplosporella prunicola CBS 121167]KAF2142056.1 hypothetical protein K452DRAFT_298063 [Aplosporella prunicola CBS 121167]
MKAIKIQSKGHAAIVDAAIPKLRTDYVLVKTVAVALNPTDWKHIDYLPSEGCTSGCDYAGIVEEVGPNVSSGLRKGDRIAGFTHGGNSSQHEDGSFGEYLVAKDGIQMKIPDGVSIEEAATLGVGITTVGQGLYQSLGLPLPEQPKDRFSVLIYGGSTATGALAIQFAKLSGLEVITTCSPHNFEMVKSLGASAAFDYRSPSCGADIRQHTNNGLYYAFDCISEGKSSQICADALSSNASNNKPAYSALLAIEMPREDIEHKYTLGYTVVGEAFFKRKQFEASKEDYEFGKMFWALSQRLLEERKFKVHRPDVRDGGLSGVLEGLEELRQGKISGKKLVYRI